MRLALRVTIATLGGLLAAGPSLAAGEIDRQVVVQIYADIAHAMYGDALTKALDLRSAIARLVEQPDESTLAGARQGWLDARVPYQQTEAYRFGNPIVDDWEGKVNSWPLDEGLIDYVEASYGDESDINDFYVANVVANPTITAGGETLDTTTIDPELLRALHEIGGIEANVATGYHAIEFLLWGQDLHGTGPGSGERPATDYDPANCTGGNCERRAAYLTAAVELLVSDLEEMVGHWAEGGDARAAVVGNPEDGLRAMLKGLGSLSYGELAGERIKLGLLLHDPEEEQDCFADNTHNSHYYDVVGMDAVYRGRYRRIDGSVVEGPSLRALLAAEAPKTEQGLTAALEHTEERFAAIKATADSGEMAYDQMLAADNPEGNALLQDAIDALVEQTRYIEQAVADLDLGSLELEGSDSLDDSEAVFQ